MVPLEDDELTTVGQLLVDLLAAPDDAVRSASMDPAEIVVPGVWLRMVGLDYTLGGAAVQAQLVLVVGDTDGGIRVARELVKLHNAVCQVLQDSEVYVSPNGATTAATAVLSDTGTPLPALVVPVNISA